MSGNRKTNGKNLANRQEQSPEREDRQGSGRIYRTETSEQSRELDEQMRHDAYKVVAGVTLLLETAPPQIIALIRIEGRGRQRLERMVAAHERSQGGLDV